MRIALTLLTVLLFSSYFLIAEVKDDLIRKHISAIGGEKNWQSIKTITTYGVKESEGSKIEERKQIIINKALRIDYKFHARDAAITNKNYFIIVNENQGWKYMPDNIRDTIETLNAEEIKYYKNDNFFMDPFLQNEKTGIKVEYMNKESILDKDCFKFSVTYPTGKSEYIYIDSRSYLISKRVAVASDSESELEFDDYRKVDNGIMIPFKVDAGFETYTLKEVLINPPLNEQIFKPAYKP